MQYAKVRAHAYYVPVPHVRLETRLPRNQGWTEAMLYHHAFMGNHVDFDLCVSSGDSTTGGVTQSEVIFSHSL